MRAMASSNVDLPSRYGCQNCVRSLEITVPAPLIYAFANGVGSVARGGYCCRTCRPWSGRRDHWADDFAGGVENERVPQIARDAFFALATFADDGLLHRLRDAMRGFVKKHFQASAS